MYGTAPIRKGRRRASFQRDARSFEAERGGDTDVVVDMNASDQRLDAMRHDDAMTATKDQAIAMAGAARTPEEVERAMMALTALPGDADVDAVCAELSITLDALTKGRIPPVSRETSRYLDAIRNPTMNGL